MLVKKIWFVTATWLPLSATLCTFYAVHFFFFFCFFNGWMWYVMCLTSEKLHNELFLSVWESTRRLIRRQLVSQFWSLGKWRGHHFAKVPPEVLLTGNLKDIVPTTDFTCTRHHRRTWWSLVFCEHWTRALRHQVRCCTVWAITTLNLKGNFLNFNHIKRSFWCIKKYLYKIGF